MKNTLAMPKHRKNKLKNNQYNFLEVLYRMKRK